MGFAAAARRLRRSPANAGCCPTPWRIAHALVEADEVDIVVAHDGAAPLLHADIVVPVIESIQVWPVCETKLETHLRVAHEVAVLFAVVTDRD